MRQIISREIEGSASTKGYRALWSSLKVSYGINIQRDVVTKMLRELDPDETETRRARRLRRRQYVSVGLTFVGMQMVMINLSLTISLFVVVLMGSHENFCGLKFPEPTVTQ